MENAAHTIASTSPSPKQSRSPKHKRPKLQLENVWVLQAQYLMEDDSKKFALSTSYFSCKKNAKEYLAYLVWEAIQTSHSAALEQVVKTEEEEKISGNLKQMKALVNQMGLAKDKKISVLLDSSIHPVITDQELLPFRIPPPKHTFDFDGICATFREFAVARDFYEAQWEAGFPEISQELMKVDLREYIKTFQDMIVFQKWLVDTCTGEDITQLSVQRALDQAECLLKCIEKPN